jgi:hypothetical protein
MKGKLPLLLTGLGTGLFIGVLGMTVIQQSKDASTKNFAVEPQDRDTEVAPLNKRIAQLESQIASLIAENRELKATPPVPTNTPPDFTDEKPNPLSSLASIFTGRKDGTNSNSEAFSNMMKAGIQQQMENKISALKLRLKLTEEQEAGIRDVLQAQFDRASEITARMFQGKISREEMEKMGAADANIDDSIRGLLTPEQVSAYDQFQKEERQLQAAQVANMELFQMQGALQLTTEQQDQVYNILYDQNLKAMSTSEGRTFDSWQDRMKARTESLRTVLTAEQFQAYEKQQEVQRQMANNLMQSFGAGTNSTAGATIQIQVAP